MDEKIEDIISAEELKQFYELAKKMEKIDRLVAKKINEQEKVEKPTKIIFSLNIDYIKEGSSVAVADEILGKIIKHYEVPLLVDEDYSEFISSTVEAINEVLQQKCDARFRKQTNESEFPA